MKFIDEWKVVLWRSASNWVSLAMGGLVGLLAWLVGLLSPVYMAAFAVIGFLPWPIVQIALAVLVGAVVIGGPPVVARLTHQPRLAARIDQKKQEAADADQPG